MSSPTATVPEQGAVAPPPPPSDIRLALLARMTSLFETETDLEATLQGIADFAVPDFADYVTVDQFNAIGELERVAVASCERTDWSEQLIAETRRGLREEPPKHDFPIWRAALEQKSALITEMDEETMERAAYSPGHLALMRAVAPISLIFAPLVARGTTFGVMQFCSYRGSRRYEGDSLAIANDIAQRAAFAISNARLHAEREREIAERRAMEETLRASDALLRTIIDSTTDLIFARDRAGRTILANRAGAQLASTSPDALIGLHATKVFGDAEGRRILREDAGIFDTGESASYETLFQTPIGPRDYHVVKHPLRDARGVPFGVVSVSRDITDQKEANARVVARERRVSLILDSAPVAMILFRVESDGGLRVAEANAFFEQLTGLARVAVVEKRVEACFTAEMMRTSGECIALALSTRTRTDRMVCDVEYPSGRRTVESIATPVFGDHGVITHVLLAAHDVGERECALRAVAESEERYRVLFESSPVPMWVYDPQSLRFLEVNAAAVERYGWTREEFLTLSMNDIRPSEDVPAFHRSLERIGQGGVLLTPTRHRLRDGRLIDVEIYGTDIVLEETRGRFVYAADVTEQRRMSEQLVQAQKTEAVGRLAGGIAHDFNNLLTVINGFARLAITRLAEGGKLTDELEQVVRASDRAASLTRQLLAYSRRQLLQPQRIDANEVVREVAQMLRRTLGEDVAIELQLSARDLAVFVDPAQLHTVLVNLALNARDAMPDGGCLTIASSKVARQPDPGAPRYVAIAVRDEGKGMDAATRARLFEPFFTTKGVGKGTGLGLATAYGIVTQSGGFLEVDSAPSEGTTFTVFLPEAAAPEGRSDDESPVAVEAARASGIVLLAEDDPSVRALTTRYLHDAGYEVHAASSGEQALALAETLPTIDLLVADVIMPGMSGRTLAERLSAQRPDLRVLFVSGYTADIVARHGILEPGIVLLEKPFTSSDLLSALRSLPARERP